MVCFRYVIVNTLHKGDNKDDDDDNNNNDTENSDIGHCAHTAESTM